ncbi:ArsR/SmtB family transcription factor [Bradyrhizobium australiense]|uniref:Winged helix-turn-helix transcriptional regulator n=1 Tax=Bradyrhizobium australiense TaxID=2721161 RepID=A0A7Y4GNT8_9BRAD|nr:metalloregulator ArsR/SmtB family transcription factor [Bradyrhizobium australiense]NOJ38873.1 winged helix-turn-helix transcriptional regulator [Bradyrhizobium australiense]
MAYNNQRGITALADPTRRQIFELVAKRPQSVADLTRALPVSQSAVSQHLKILKSAKLVRAEAAGARNIYRVDPAGLGQMRAWLDRQWRDALDALKTEIDNKEQK